MKRKSRFFTFCTSLIPGAGQMYQGHMRRGISIMLVFVLIAAFSVFTNIAEAAFILPVIWFYAFFDSMNNSGLTIDELRAIEDKPIINIETLKKFDNSGILNFKGGSVVLGAVIIFIGATMLYRTLIMPIINNLWNIDVIPPVVYYTAVRIPALLIGVVIILIGVRIIKGSKK